MPEPFGGSLSFSAAAFLSLFIEAICYGLFITIYIISTSVLCRKGSARTSKREVNVPLTTISTLMFIFSTMHFIINAWRGYQAFVVAGDPQIWLIVRGTKAPDFLLKNLLFKIQVSLADGFLIWRLYMVYFRNKLLVAPFLLLETVVIATGITIIVLHATRDPKTPLFGGPYLPVGAAFFACTTVLNLGCSSLIAIRLYRAQRASSSSRRLSQAAALILESASIYTAVMILTFALYLARSGAMKIALDAAMHIIGITFCGIIVSVQLGFSVPRRSIMHHQSSHSHQCTCPELSACGAVTGHRGSSSLSTRMTEDGGIKFDTLAGDSSFVSITPQDEGRLRSEV